MDAKTYKTLKQVTNQLENWKTGLRNETVGT